MATVAPPRARVARESQKLSVVFGPNATYSEIFNGRIRIELNLIISQMRISGSCYTRAVQVPARDQRQGAAPGQAPAESWLDQRDEARPLVSREVHVPLLRSHEGGLKDDHFHHGY